MNNYFFSQDMHRSKLWVRRSHKVLVLLIAASILLPIFAPYPVNAQENPAAMVQQNLYLPFISSQSETDTETEGMAAALPAFPGAQGHGALAVGGRGGRIIEVTNLNDSGPGSLREAINASGKRIVVFRVAGLITVSTPLLIKNPYITIAGQTAPGGGITIRAVQNTVLQIDRNVHDVVIRYLRLRNGSGVHSWSDNLAINGGYNIIIDHVSMSWSGDENVEIWQHPNSLAIRDVTIQRSIMAEGIDTHSNGLIIGGNTTYDSQGNPTEQWRRITQVSLHHNLFAHNSHRNPRVTAAGVEVINNVTYNWRWFVVFTTMATKMDWRANYSKAGPMSLAPRIWYHQQSTPQSAYPASSYVPSLYVKDNLAVPTYPDPNADNWLMLKDWDTSEPLPTSYRRNNPMAAAPIPVEIQSAADAYTSVMADVGANARLACDGTWIPAIDAVDMRVLNDIAAGTGPSTPLVDMSAVGGYPVINAGTPCADSDKDGMPDAWENLHGFNPSSAADSSLDADGDGYTNVEEYLNGTNPRG